MRLKLYSIIFSFSISLGGLAQERLYLNANQSLVQLNPSFAGSNGFIRNQAVYRNQTTDFKGNSSGLANTFDAYIKPIHAGMALSYAHNDMDRGTMKSDYISLTYAQYFSSKNKKLQVIPSFQLAYVQKTLDASNISFSDFYIYNYQYSSINWCIPPQVITNASKKYVDFNAGLLFKIKNFYLGSTISHLNQPDVGLLGTAKLPARIGAHVSYNWHLSEKTLIHFLFKYDNPSWYQRSYQFTSDAVLFKHLLLGLGYDTYVGALGSIGFRNNFFSTSVLFASRYRSTIPVGTWQVMLSYNLRNKDQRKTLLDFESW